MKFLAVAALIVLAQGIPVIRLAGGAGDQAATPQPAQTPPQAPPSLPAMQLDPSTAATLDSPRRLTLSFSEPRPVQEVMRLLVAGTPFSLAVDADIDGTFQGELKQLTLRESLRTILDPLGLDFTLQGTVIRVTRDRTEMRQFDLNLLAVQRVLAHTTSAGPATLLTTAPADDVFAGVADGVRALLSPIGTVHVDRRAGLAQVTDVRERLDRVALYLEALQVRSGRQVRLEARVLEVTLNDAASIDWRAVRERLGLPRDAPQAGLAADPAALQAALAAQGDVRVLSAPEVTTMNNEPALVRAGTPGGSSITMTVVPQISADGIVLLSVSHAWEEQDGSRSAARTAEADTVTRVMDRNTVMIAGPLRSIQEPTRTVRAELVVLLRPTVVTPGFRP